jgi:hypothetical protein
LKAQFELAASVGNKLAEVHEAIRKIRDIRDQIKEISDRAVNAGFTEKIKTARKDLDEILTEIEDELIQTKSKVGQDPINYPPRIDNQYAYLLRVVNGQDARPTEGCYRRFEDLNRTLDEKLRRLDQVVDRNVTAFVRTLEDAGVERIIVKEEMED